MFADDCLIADYGHRIKNVDIARNFQEYTENKWGRKFPYYFHKKHAPTYNNIYEFLAVYFPSIVPKYVTDNDKGFVGLRFK